MCSKRKNRANVEFSIPKELDVQNTLCSGQHSTREITQHEFYILHECTNAKAETEEVTVHLTRF